MQVVVDANPLISILIKSGKPTDLLFLEELELFAPTLLFKELERNKKEIIEKSELSEEEINEFLNILKQRITVIPEEEFVKFREEAEAVCPDEKDIVYFALALYLRCAIWSNEKRLKEQQKEVEVYSTHELIKLFGID